MIRLALVAACLILTACQTEVAQPASAATEGAASLSGLSLTKLDGTPMAASTLKNKVVLFVNVASRCGFTKQYEGLQKLYEAKKDDGLVIVGVPCNQFGGQEPGSPEEIQSFCKMNYGVTFPLLEKQQVNGAKRSALYQMLVDSPAGGGSKVGWNFEKFLVGRDGSVASRFPSRVAPDSPELLQAIEDALRTK